MNKTMRIVVISGGVAIILLGAIFFLLSKKTNYEVEKSLNNALDDFARNVSLGNNPIDKVDYSPFECDGIRDYTCKTSNITFRINGIKDIKFSNVKLGMRDIPNRKHVFFKLKTDIDYIDNNIPKKGALDRLSAGKLPGLHIMPISDIISSISILLPNKIACEQDYDYRGANRSKAIDIKTNCDFYSSMFDTNFTLENTLSANLDNPHVLGAIYDILRSISSVENSYKSTSIDNITHVIRDMSITLDSNMSLNDYLASQDSLSKQQRDRIRNYILSLKTVGNFALENANIHHRSAKYHLSFLLNNVYKIITKDINALTMKITSKDNEKVDSMHDFLTLGNASIIEWIIYLDRYYNIQYYINGKPYGNVTGSQPKHGDIDTTRDSPSLDNTSLEKGSVTSDQTIDSKANNESMDTNSSNTTAPDTKDNTPKDDHSGEVSDILGGDKI